MEINYSTVSNIIVTLDQLTESLICLIELLNRKLEEQEKLDKEKRYNEY